MMKVVLTLVVVFYLCFHVAFSQNNCQGTINPNAIITTEPQLIATVPNGKLYKVPIDDLSPALLVVSVWGTSYEMGVAEGQLLKDNMTDFFAQVEEYFQEQIDSYVSSFPPDLQKLFEELGVDALNEALNLEIDATKHYTPAHFIEEMQGISNGSGIDVNIIWRWNLLPELIKAACSMYGAWGNAVANTSGNFFQLRALDWTANGPFQKFAAVTVYHPTDGGVPFASLGWTGFIGSLTGFSSTPFGVCEKVWLSSNSTENRFGIPWPFIMRDIIQFDKTMDDAYSRITNAKRTCPIWIGLGDGQSFTAVQYSYQEVNFWDYESYPNYIPGHPQIPDVVYVDKHVQPSHDPCFSSLLQEYYGRLDAENTIKYITSQLETGDTHLAVMDFENNLFYVANASPFVNNSFIPAYMRPAVRLNMTQLFSDTM